MRSPATGPDMAVPGCDEADNLGLAALPQWPLSSAIRYKTHPACRLMGALRYKTHHACTLMGALRYKTHPVPTLTCPNRYKTHPAHTPVHPNRYITRHTTQKSHILAHFRRAGRKLSRFSQSQPQQGEYSHADHAPIALVEQNSRQNSPSTHADMPKPVQNSPSTHAGPPQPVHNSPYNTKIAHFGPFSACRAKIVTLQSEPTAAGRIFSRRERKRSKQDDLWCAASGRFLSRRPSAS